MESLNDMKKLRSIEHGLIRRQQTYNPNGIEELHSIDELSQEVDVVFIFEGPNEFHDEWRGDCG
jgi:hypothetical protein